MYHVSCIIDINDNLREIPVKSHEGQMSLSIEEACLYNRSENSTVPDIASTSLLAEKYADVEDTVEYQGEGHS